MSMLPTHTLRAATPADAAIVTLLVQAAYLPYVERLGAKPGPMHNDYGELIDDGKVTVAELGGEIAGILVMNTNGTEGVIENVAVLPERQGCGIGRMMLDYAERCSAEAGHSSIRLYTHERMTENLALYKSRGYEEFARESLLGGGELVHLRKPLATLPAGDVLGRAIGP